MIFFNMPEAEYRLIPALSGTGCAEIMKSPAHFQASLSGRDETAAMAFGTAAHKMILEGSVEFAKIYTAEKVDRRTKEGKARADEIAKSGRKLIDPEQLTDLGNMRESIMKSPMSCALLHAPGQSEVSIIATDPETGCKVKGRIDRLPDSGGYLVDLKTTADTLKWKPDDYLLQACHYIELCKIAGLDRIKAVAFVVVETSAPYAVRVVSFDAQALEIGAERVREAWNIYASCLESDQWPALNRGLEVASLSPWLMK